jgi:hypothetical protein
MLSLLLACSHPGSVGGQVTDARTQKPISSLEVAWVSEGADACARRATQTDGAGSYHLDGICPDHSYHLQFSDPDWWVEAPPLQANPQGTEMDLALWRVPSVEGVYLLKGSELSALKPQSAVDRLPLVGQSQELRFPLEIPGNLPRIEGDTLLVLAGEKTQKLSFEPLLPAGPLQFGTPEAPQAVGAWFYIGSQVKGQDQVEAAVAQPSTVKTVGKSPQIATYVDVSALPPGRYALGGPDARRVYLVDFGPASK